MGIEACFAGHWDIPVIFAQGDEMACREAEAVFPGITTAAVKHSLDHDTCEGPDLVAAHRLTAAKLTEALDRLRAGDCRPFQPTLPMYVTLRMALVPVSYTHLTLPTIYPVYISVVDGSLKKKNN